MPIPQKIIKFLEKNKAKYEIIKHRTVYTAFDKAATLRVRPNLIGKTLVVKSDSNLAIVLIPANKNLDKNKFKNRASIYGSEGKEENGVLFAKSAKAQKADFASEKLMKNKLKGVKIGASPPFGDLWKLPTFIDRGLFNNPKIIMNSGDYNFSIKITPTNLKKLTPNLIIGNFSKSRR